MDTTTPRAASAAPIRSVRDRRARRFLALDPDGPRSSIFGAHGLFSRSIALSAARCLVTYVLVPVLLPIIDFSGLVGPVVGLVLGAVSIVAIYVATRRFFAADHKWRWGYAAVGGAIVVLLVASALVDLARLAA